MDKIKKNLPPKRKQRDNLMADQPSPHQNVYKYGSLCVLTLQNALLILSMRYSRVQDGDMYITTTAVVLSETLKIVLCLIILFFSLKVSIKDYLLYLYNALIVEWKDTLMLSVPAIVYMIQNNLQYVAVSNLEAAVFQVTYQLKILTTALFSVLLLSKVLSKAQWGSLVMLFVGIAMIQLQKTPSETDNKHQNQVIGLVAVTISCLSSGFAGVYMEKKIKNTTAPVWLKNIQLSIFGSMTAVIGMLVTDAGNISEKGFFHGYSPLVVFVIFQQAVGGLIVALVVKYADNILKGFSTSLSIIISCFFSVYMFNFHISFEFVIGTVLVILAIYIYGKFQAPKPSIPTLPVTIKPSVPETSSEMQHSTS